MHNKFQHPVSTYQSTQNNFSRTTGHIKYTHFFRWKSHWHKTWDRMPTVALDSQNICGIFVCADNAMPSHLPLSTVENKAQYYSAAFPSNSTLKFTSAGKQVVFFIQFCPAYDVVEYENHLSVYRHCVIKSKMINNYLWTLNIERKNGCQPQINRIELWWRSSHVRCIHFGWLCRVLWRHILCAIFHSSWYRHSYAPAAAMRLLYATLIWWSWRHWNIKSTAKIVWLTAGSTNVLSIFLFSMCRLGGATSTSTD